MSLQSCLIYVKKLEKLLKQPSGIYGPDTHTRGCAVHAGTVAGPRPRDMRYTCTFMKNKLLQSNFMFRMCACDHVSCVCLPRLCCCSRGRIDRRFEKHSCSPGRAISGTYYIL